MSLGWGTRSPSSLLLAYRTPVMTWWKGQRIGAGSLVLVDEVYTCLSSPDGTRQWNHGDQELTTSKLAAMAKELCSRNGIQINRISTRHRVADAAIGAALGSDDGSIGAQLKAHGAGFVAAPKGRRAPGWQAIARLMEAAGDPFYPGLYATPKVESFWATVPGLTYSKHDPEDLDTTQPDHVGDSLRYMVMATNDARYSYRAGGTIFRVWRCRNCISLAFKSEITSSWTGRAPARSIDAAECRNSDWSEGTDRTHSCFWMRWKFYSRWTASAGPSLRLGLECTARSPPLDRPL